MCALIHVSWLLLEVRFHTRAPPGHTHLDQVVEEDEGGLHDSGVLVAEHSAEVVLQVGHGARREEKEVVHGHDRLLAYQLPGWGGEREGRGRGGGARWVKVSGTWQAFSMQ